MSPYERGKLAALAGKDEYLDNPYLAGSEEWVEWREGYEDGSKPR